MILLYLKIERRPPIKGVPIKLAIESLVSHYNRALLQNGTRSLALLRSGTLGVRRY